jgi:amino-acid N-acetyltransferase
VTITVLGDRDRDDIVALLEASHLPAADLPEARPHFLGLRDDLGLVGVVGVEALGTVGLLRSLAVRHDKRGTGLGTQLAQRAEEWAMAAGISELYLLTTTAEAFFAHREYRVRSRDEVNEVIRTTTEFSGACPASAVVMCRRLR